MNSYNLIISLVGDMGNFEETSGFSILILFYQETNCLPCVCLIDFSCWCLFSFKERNWILWSSFPAWTAFTFKICIFLIIIWTEKPFIWCLFWPTQACVITVTLMISYVLHPIWYHFVSLPANQNEQTLFEKYTENERSIVFGNAKLFIAIAYSLF